MSIKRTCVSSATSLMRGSPLQACAWPSAAQMPCQPKSWEARYFSSESADKVPLRELTRPSALSSFRTSMRLRVRAFVSILSVAPFCRTRPASTRA